MDDEEYDEEPIVEKLIEIFDEKGERRKYEEWERKSREA
jgi:hypothetical protein